MVEQELAEIVLMLVDVPGLTVKPEHKDYIHKLITKYPQTDIKAVLEKWAASTIDQPLKKGARVCGQWLTWVKNAERWGQDKRKPAEVAKHIQQDDKFRLIHWGV